MAKTLGKRAWEDEKFVQSFRRETLKHETQQKSRDLKQR